MRCLSLEWFMACHTQVWVEAREGSSSLDHGRLSNAGSLRSDYS